MEQGVYWFRQRKNGKNPEAIVYLSLVNKSIFQLESTDQVRFKAEKSGSSFSLTIDTFQEKDQGTYYCMFIKNFVLTFSPGHQLFYPEVTTPKPTTTKPPPATTAKESKSEENCNCISGKKVPTETKTESWKIDC
ncbi:unnamed protein product, partial [Staurois parvus]